MVTNLNESVAFLIIALNCKYRIARASGADLHLSHLGVKQVGKILLVDLWSDTADVKTP